MDNVRIVFLGLWIDRPVLDRELEPGSFRPRESLWTIGGWRDGCDPDLEVAIRDPYLGLERLRTSVLMEATLLEELPRAASVLATLRSIVGSAGTIRMRDYGHGLGAVHVTLPHWLTPALGELSGSSDWEFVGRTEDTEDDTAASCIEFSRWVRLDVA